MSNFVPEGWLLSEAEELYSRMRVPQVYDRNLVNQSGKYPVLDQSENGCVGYLNSKPEFECNPSSPLTTFANHTCAVRQMTRSFGVIQNVFPLKAKAHVSQEFLFQILKGAIPQNGYKGHYPDLREKLFLTPPLPEQQKIASILSSVDDVIEKTRAQIDKLKDLKTGMMQELLTKGIGHTEFKDSPVGWIPSNWDVGAIDSFGVDILDGDRGNEYPKEKDFYPFEHCLFLSAKNVTKKGFAFTTLSFITKEKDELLRKGKLTRGDIVITTRGTVGNIAFYDDEVPFDHIRINSGMAIIRNKSEALDSQFLHLLMNSPMVSEQVELLAFGSAQPQLTIGIIKGLNIPKPSIDEQKAIASAVSSTTKKLQLATKKLALLESTKKALMQDLLTGKVRVKLTDKAQAGG